MWETLRNASAGVLGWFGRAATGASEAMLNQSGLPWPPPEELPRLRRYRRNYMIYRGRHEAVFVGGYKDEGEVWKYSYDETVEYIAVNFLGRVSKLLASRLFGEGVRISAPDGADAAQEFLDALYRNEHLEHRNMIAARGASYRGEAVYKVWYDAKRKRIRVGTVLPSLWFPEADTMDRSQIAAHSICQVLTGADGDRDHYHLWVERHEMLDGVGWITNRVYAAEKASSGYRYHPDREIPPDQWRQWPRLEGLEPEINTGIDDMLVVHVPNIQAEEESFWGQSDYDELLTLQGELNNRWTQREDVLDKHTDPPFYGPENALVVDPDHPGEPASVRLDEMKYLKIRPDGRAPAGYITWDGHLENVENELKECIDNIAAVIGIDVQAIKPAEGMGPTSGRALRLGQMNTQTTVGEKRMTFGPAKQRVFSLATKLANARGVQLDGPKPEVLQVSDIGVHFGDGLPQDVLEDVQVQNERLASGTQHPVDAIMELDGLSRDDAEDKYARILAAQASAVAPAGGIGPVAFASTQ